MSSKEEEIYDAKDLSWFPYPYCLAISLLFWGCTSAPPVDDLATRAYADPMTENMLQASTRTTMPSSPEFQPTNEGCAAQTAFGTLTSQVKAKVGDYQSKQFVKTQLQSGSPSSSTTPPSVMNLRV